MLLQWSSKKMLRIVFRTTPDGIFSLLQPFIAVVAVAVVVAPIAA